MGNIEEKEIYKVSIISILSNVLLSLFKLIAGVFGNSMAMISDGIHSLSDVFTTIVVMIGIKMSQKDADKEHPYGHERMECVASILLAASLVIVGITIFISAINTIINPKEVKSIGTIALIAAIISIVIKESMYRYTIIVANKVDSCSLKSDAWHHRSDALSSIGSLIGIGFAKIGFSQMDYIASMIISGMILKAAYDIFKDGIDRMLDHSADERTEESIRSTIMEISEVINIDDLKTRKFGNKIYVDVEILLDGNISLTQAHKIAHEVHDLIESRFPKVKHCMVHMNPKNN